jgi:hypothetical protein
MVGRLLRGAGEEDLFGVSGDDAVESELAGVLSAKLEEEAGAVAGFGVDDVDELHLWGAVEVGRVGDALEGGFDFAEGVGLRDDGDITQGCAGAAGVGGVDIGCVATVAQGVCLQLLVEQRHRRRTGACGAVCAGGRGSGFLRCGR